GADGTDEHQGALWLLSLAWSVFNKVQLCHVFLAFLFYYCCHALAATDAHGGKAEGAALTLEAVRQSDQHAGAGRADWVAQGNAGTPGVEAGVIPGQVPFLQHGACRRRECSVALNRVQFIDANAGALQCLLGGRNRSHAHGLWCNACNSPALEAQHWGQAQLRGLLAGGDNHRRRAIILRRRITCGHGCFLILLTADGAQLSKLFWGGAFAWAFIDRNQGWFLAALFRRNRNRHDLLIEPVLRLSLQRTLMGCRSHLVLCLTGELVIAANVFSGLNHAAWDRVVLAAGGLSRLGQAVTQLHVTALHTPADGTINGVLGARHGFRATSDNEVCCPHGHVCGRGHDSLQAGTATAV